MRLATDDRKFRTARDHAYALAAQAALYGGEFEELEDITDRWSKLSPDRDDPVWGHALALARQNRHREGLAFLRRRDIQPTTDGNRHLLFAELLMEGSDSDSGADRMRSLMELSDSFDQPVELERNAMRAATVGHLSSSAHSSALY